MSPIRDAIVATLSPAVRARTVVASGTHLAWTLDGSTLVLPYVDVDGSPVLAVSQETSRRLLAVGVVDVEMCASRELGVVLLSGTLEATSSDSLGDDARDALDARCTCGASECDSGPTALVRIHVNRIRITGGSDVVFVDVPREEYESTSPDTIIAQGCVVAQHLNSDHADDVAALAARVTGRRPNSILASAIVWIDAYGLDLVVVDGEGSSVLRTPFAQPLKTISDLGLRMSEIARSRSDG